MKIAHINENNQILGWYDSEIHDVIPTPNIEVSEEVWQNAINKGHNKVNDDGTTEYFDFRTKEEIEAQELATKLVKAKEAKQLALDNITVEVNGKVFDGNETARNNMLASIQASQLLNIESTYWKLADNSVQEVTVEEIKEALAKAIQRVGEIVTQ